MKTTQIRSHVGTDGMLELKVPVGVTETDVDVVVVVQPVPATPKSDAQQREWEEFVWRTAGSIDDPSFIRHPQGEFEKREELS